jgi:UDP-N-acetylmuramate dehydrogenase
VATKSGLSPSQLIALRARFGNRLQENVVMANYTTAHVGGLADMLLIINSSVEFEKSVTDLWNMQIPLTILGSGANVLVSDAGIHGVVLINRAHTVKINTHGEKPTVWAESGANLGGAARQVALRGLSGLEWAAQIPGSIGGAVYGNAGANGGDMKGNLIVAEILHHDQGKLTWNSDQMNYSYRSSLLKRQPGQAIILAAVLSLTTSTRPEVEARMKEFNERRQKTQPPGASIGSTFKNPPGDAAGRLIEAAGLKGKHIGKVEISPIHANFFINKGGATATDYWNLVNLAQKTVFDKFGVQLELEIELLGEWEQA